LVWGVHCYYYDKMSSTDKTFSDIIKTVKANQRVTPGNMVVNIPSVPIREAGMTKTLKLEQIYTFSPCTMITIVAIAQG
jgi:pyruvate kinase